ncbi:alpha/beta fold hydrolase [Aspergillus candidus]|uniref:Epoxide hydrolase n=1 Tax=Aspergillus candidus TaxID=41067 RepID=A0A2I2F8S2_ASPCN|nr:epoxide hydrolase [Aspergillus candidus]PLB37021.1 epoxide hydrolase [Aspergillus candidus]
MAVDKINVAGDDRVQYRSADVNGIRYGYLYAEPPSGQYKATVFLIHGFPDLSIGWRYQIPMLLDKGLRVVAPDCLGYGQTDAPEDLERYAHKRHADDIKALAAQLGESKIIVGGHDWGASLAYRVALWHPDLVSHVFTVCVPYASPTPRFATIAEMVAHSAPHFAYQLQFISGEVERAFTSREQIKAFLNTLYGGRTAEKEVAFDVQKGVLMDKVFDVGRSRLLSEEELDYYVSQYARNGLHGPLNWYRTRQKNHTDELTLLNRTITAPVLFIQALRDSALPPHLGRNMASKLPSLTVETVDSTHWALWEKPAEVNAFVGRWLEEVVFRDLETFAARI